MVLNLVNSESIAEIAGTDDYEQWPSVRVQLYATKTEFQGKRVPCIRIEAPPTARKAAPAPIAEEPPGDDVPMPDDADAYTV